tara:strand:- start:46 stop:351 length:306 start_codon:yes stop_codon:yes gene_type:complete
MRKLNKLYEAIDSKEFKTTKTGEDPETGSVSWDVEYEKKTPKLYDFKESYNDLNELVNNMVKINGGIKPTDPKLEELVLVIKNIRNRYKRYLNQYQPDWNS